MGLGKERLQVARRLTANDLYRFRWISDPQTAPDGRRVAYVVTWAERGDRMHPYHSEIWSVPLAGGDPVRLTTGPRDRHPRWSPDGRSLAFIGSRGHGDQIFSLPAGGGEAQPLTARGGGVGSPPVWSPDSTAILFTAKAGLPPGPDDSDVRIYTRIRYKHDGVGLFDHRHHQLFVTAARVDRPTVEPRQLTAGDWDKADPAWSPDGTRIAFTGEPDPDRSDLERGAEIFTIPAGGGEPARITDIRGPKSDLAWSPDGRRIAYIGHDAHLHGATNAGIWLVAPDSREPTRLLTPDTTFTVGDQVGSDARAGGSRPGPEWSADGREVHFLATIGGTVHLFAVTADASPAVRQLTHGRGALYGFSGPAVLLSDPQNPGDLYAEDRRLTDMNPWLRDLSLSVPQPFTFQGAGDWTSDGWIMPPVTAAVDAEGHAGTPWPGAVPGSHPAVLEIHGGPHSSYGEAFSLEFQLLSAAGYAVLYCNPCGSCGYGEGFASQTRMDWGGRDYREIMGFVDAALRRAPWVDPARLGVTGGSYGGFMTNWIVGHTDRFRAAVTDRSTCNRMNHWGTGDIGYIWQDSEFEGLPFDAPDNYLRHSPLMFVRNVTAPILILQCENDYRGTTEQGEQWFVALRRLGKTAEFVRFPDESHGMPRSGQPRHRVERLERLVGWFDRFLGA